MIGNLFSESWYRVAELRAGIHSAIQSHKQFFRGEMCYVLRDPFNSRFFRLSPEAYRFVMRLNPKSTVHDLWEESLRENPDDTPSQDAVIRLLSQLHLSNLLYVENSPDTEAVFERYSRTKQKELTSKIQSFLFFRMPLWDPHTWLVRYDNVTRMIFSRGGFLVWALVVFTGFWYALENPQALYQSGQGVLAPSNIFLLYICLAGLKFLHEMGHAMATRRFGGEVHTMGVMFLILTPLPYMDATSSWAFRNRWQRALVGAAGMIVELFIAALATIVWSHTGPGVINSLAFNLMFIGSVSSLLFNGNPLTRLDSYYILSDVLEIPNLAQRSREEWRYILESKILGMPDIERAASSATESFWLLSYGFASQAYRVLLSAGIALFVLDQWFEVGLIIVAISAWTWLLKPVYNLIHYLFFDPALEMVRLRAVSLAILTISLLIGLLFYVPMSNSIRAPGVIHARDYTRIHNQTPGILKEIIAPSGSVVQTDQILARLENPDLDVEILLVGAQIQESKALEIKARENRVADLKPISERIAFLGRKLDLLKDRRDKLTVRAKTNGTWIAPDLRRYLGTWAKAGAELGAILPSQDLEFVAVVSQENAYDLFELKEPQASLKFRGQSEITLPVTQFTVIPHEKDELPSMALGWYGGGDIAVEREDGLKTQESFFEARAVFHPHENLKTLHGRTGEIRIELADSSVMGQFMLFLKQLLQKRYQF